MAEDTAEEQNTLKLNQVEETKLNVVHKNVWFFFFFVSV